MRTRVLFVDDDAMLLSSIERCLGLNFDVSTALSGADALRLLSKSGPPDAIVTDMRMPIMDGVEFIRRARELAPRAAYLMLTGNQDLDTATRAVNEGAVSHFLNKPCDPDEISRAIECALERCRGARRERELGQAVTDGAVAIAANLLKAHRPEWIDRAARAGELMSRVRADLGLAPRPEFPLAAELAPIGFARLSGQRFAELLAATPGEPEHMELLSEAFDESAELVAELGRLESAAEMVRLASSSDGSFAGDDADQSDLVRQGAALLRAAYLVEALRHARVEPAEARRRIAAAMPGASASFVEVAAAAVAGAVTSGVARVRIADLRDGMVLEGAIRGDDGRTLMSAGRRLSRVHVENLLQRFGDDSDCFAEVRADSIEPAAV